MKRITLAVALLAAAPLVLAQTSDTTKAPEAAKASDAAKAPDVPKPNCGTPPELPGNTMLQDQSVRKRFETDVSKYKECMKTYVDDRQAAARANAAAGNEAVTAFNAWAKALDEEQKRRRGGGTESQRSGAGPNVQSY
jgi:hypothetical protein